MPNIKSSQKRMELSRKWAAENRTARSKIRTAIKKVRQAQAVQDAEAGLGEAVSLLDRSGRKNLIHPNRVARLKRQLQLRVNTLSKN
jgi:small subunit ribosomal protein S20